MGTCLSLCREKSYPPIDTSNDTSEFSATQVRQIMDTLGVRQCIHIPDRHYLSVKRNDIEAFLDTDEGKYRKYTPETYDCDDFALVLCGNVRKWGLSQGLKFPLFFGILHGDIRRNEDDTTVRPHAVNFFTDNAGVVWIVEPQSHAVSRPTSNSTFTFAYC